VGRSLPRGVKPAGAPVSLGKLGSYSIARFMDRLLAGKELFARHMAAARSARPVGNQHGRCTPPPLPNSITPGSFAGSRQDTLCPAELMIRA
jgi:hypothetical protein